MGDLDDVAAMADGAKGCEYAFHAAASLGDWGRREDFVHGNVTGTENALRACREAGVRRFVHVGTEAALLVGQPLVNADERVPLRPDSKAHYPATKAMAEQAVLDANRDGFETVVLRPRLVWGPGDTTILPGAEGGGRQGPLLLDRRRRPQDVDDARGQRGRGARPGRHARKAGERVLRDRRRPGGVPRLHHRADGDRGRRDARPERPVAVAKPLAGSAKVSGARSAHLRPTPHPPRRLALGAGVHDRHLEGAQRARLRAGQDDRGGHGGAAAA